jgi:hypothetical protein
MRSVLLVDKNGIFRHPPAAIVVERFAGIRVNIKPWKIAARNVDAYSMASLENK